MRSIQKGDRRIELLCWAAGLGAVTAEALAVRDGTTTCSARAKLAGAVRVGALTSHRPLTGWPALYTVTPSGLRAAGLAGLRPTRVGPASARHQIACAMASVWLEHGYPHHLVVGERALREHERLRGAPLASVVLGGAHVQQALHRPDLVLLAQAGTRERAIAVEVELTVKAPRRLVSICRAWARSRHVDGALYLAPPEVERALLRAIDAARAGDRVGVVPLEWLA